MVRKVLKIAAMLIGAAVLLTPIIICLIANHKIEAALARARKAGEPITWAELLPPVPREENALHVYEECAEIMNRMPEQQKDEDGRLFMMPPEQIDYAKLERRLADWREVLLLLEKAAPLPRFQVQIKWMGTTFPLSTTPDSRLVGEDSLPLLGLARLLRANALLSVHRGDIGMAFQSCVQSYRLAQHVLQQPDSLALMIGVAIQQLATRSLIEVIRLRHDIPQSELAGLLKEFPSFDTESAFTRSLYTERLLMLRLMEQMGVGKGLGAAFKRQGSRILFAGDIETVSKMIELSRQPYHELLASDAVSVLSKPVGTRFPLLSGLLLPTHMKARRFVAWGEADYDALKLVIALRIYKLRHGSYPESLKPLAEILGELPKDPFTGKDFVYERKGEGFRILRGNDPKDERKEKDRYWELER